MNPFFISRSFVAIIFCVLVIWTSHVCNAMLNYRFDIIFSVFGALWSRVSSADTKFYWIKSFSFCFMVSSWELLWDDNVHIFDVIFSLLSKDFLCDIGLKRIHIQLSAGKTSNLTFHDKIIPRKYTICFYL